MQNSQLKLVHINQFTSDVVRCANKGILQECTAGQTTDIDLQVADDMFITGGILSVKGGVFGDHVTFQVIDKDNILGYGNNIILGEFITSWYIVEDSEKQFDENQTYPSKIYSGLYLRIKYTSTGTDNVFLTMNYRLHKAMV